MIFIPQCGRNTCYSSARRNHPIQGSAVTLVKTGLAVSVVCSLFMTVPGGAQERDPARTQRMALNSLPVACAGYTQLCPQPDYGTIGARALLICLKSHTVDVSLTCRQAVAAAQAPVAPP